MSSDDLPEPDVVRQYRLALAAQYRERAARLKSDIVEAAAAGNRLAALAYWNNRGLLLDLAMNLEAE